MSTTLSSQNASSYKIAYGACAIASIPLIGPRPSAWLTQNMEHQGDLHCISIVFYTIGNLHLAEFIGEGVLNGRNSPLLFDLFFQLAFSVVFSSISSPLSFFLFFGILTRLLDLLGLRYWFGALVGNGSLGGGAHIYLGSGSRSHENSRHVCASQVEERK